MFLKVFFVCALSPKKYIMQTYMHAYLCYFLYIKEMYALSEILIRLSILCVCAEN